MERVTDEQLQAAHDGCDSGVYKELEARRDAELTAEALQITAGCLIKEGREFGFTSGTPYECPVGRCQANFDSGKLAVANEVACQNPLYQQRPKY